MAIQEKEEIAEPIKKTSVTREIISWVILIAAAFLIAYIITHYVIVKAVVPSGSMENTIMTNDQIVGNRLAYLFSDPKRGDIIIFKFPDDETQNYVKRIIGMPGDTVQIIDGVLYINGIVYEEDYLKEAMWDYDFGPYVVPQGHYFMLGDNRNTSIDSRYWTNQFVAEDKIIGKAWFRYKPKLTILK